MKNDFKHSDTRMQEKLDGFQMPAPESAWAGIEGAIGGKSSNRKGFLFLWIALLFVSLLGAGFLTFNHFTGASVQNSSTSALAKTTQNKNAEKSNNHSNRASFDSSSKVLQTRNQTNNEFNNIVTNSDKGSVSDANNSNTSKSNSFSSSNSKNPSSSKTAKQQSNASNSAGQRNAKRRNAVTNGALALDNNSNIKPNEEDSRLSDHRSNASSSKNIDDKNEPSKTPSFLTLSALPPKSIQDFLSGTGPTVSSFQKELKMPRGTWSLEAGLDLSAFNYTATGNGGTDVSFVNNSYSSSNGQAGFLRVNYQPLSYLSINTGVEYGSNSATQDYSTFTPTTTFQYDTVGYYFDSISQQQLPIVDTTSTVSQVEQVNQVNSSFSQVNIPVGVMFHLSVGTRSELGVNLAGLVGIRTKSTGSILLDANGTTADAVSSYRSVNFAMRASIRFSYLLNENMAVYAEPHLGFGLNNQSSASLPFATRFRNSGVRIGFRYHF
ncbi:MAG: hypothetical protein Crog4KO_13210 [Crocinitomicaceae bacterium]